MIRKNFSLVISGFLTLTSPAFCGEADFVTYDWLIDCAKKSGYTDHIPHFRRLFNTMQVRGLLECGCGYSTKFFLDHCQKVISIEFMSPGTGDIWFNECLRLYKDRQNWVPLAYNTDHSDVSFNNACAYACSDHRDYSLIDPRYLQSLDLYFKKQIAMAKKEGKDIDIAFVDPGVYPRGEMVKVLLENKVPIVMAHDTACDVGDGVDEGFYIWFAVKTPEDYKKIYIPFGQGTTFWIHKSLPQVIQSISTYRSAIKPDTTYEQLQEIADRM